MSTLAGAIATSGCVLSHLSLAYCGLPEEGECWAVKQGHDVLYDLYRPLLCVQLLSLHHARVVLQPSQFSLVSESGFLGSEVPFHRKERCLHHQNRMRMMELVLWQCVPCAQVYTRWRQQQQARHTSAHWTCQGFRSMWRVQLSHHCLHAVPTHVRSR